MLGIQGKHSMFDATSLNAALMSVGANSSIRLFEALQSAYKKPGRYYHTATHVAECLHQAKRYGHLATSLEEIEVAIWFHDAVYDTQRNDNEEKSAEWAERELSSLGARVESIARISEMMLATRTHSSTNLDTLLLIDIDLGILGAEPAIFEHYDQAIRREYSWVPEPDYRAGRIKVLSSFLERPAIFQTSEINVQYEVRARENLQRKIIELVA
jgi:predicted metal-dependent HD superfamily phosphohydrolase